MTCQRSTSSAKLQQPPSPHSLKVPEIGKHSALVVYLHVTHATMSNLKDIFCKLYMYALFMMKFLSVYYNC